MHICFITSEYPKKGFPHGGVGTFVETLSKKIIETGMHRVSVIGLNYTNDYEESCDEGIFVFRLNPSKLKLVGGFINHKQINDKIKQIHEQNPIDIVEASELGLAFLNKIKSIKYIIRLHGGHHFFAEAENRGVDFWKGYQEKKSFKKADAFIAVSNYVKEHTSKYLNFNNKYIEIINCSISFSKFKPSKAIKVKDKLIVFAGTVCEKKGVRQLIQALQIVLKKYPNAQLNIYGRDWFFPDKKSYIAYLKTVFSKKELEKVTFFGSVPHQELSKLYQEAEVCVFPSHMETQGLVAPEAMAVEKVVVFSETGPGPETIIPLRNGLLCNPHNPIDIAEKIFWVFENPEKSIAIGKNARKDVLEKFDADSITKKNINFYKSIL